MMPTPITLARWALPAVLALLALLSACGGNVTQQAPFRLLPGAAPRLNAQDVADIAAFLRTLSDGFQP